MDDTKLDETIELLKTQLLLRPNDAHKLFLLANAYRKGQRLDDAIASFKKATASKPSFADAHHQLGATHRQRGELDLALLSFDNALAVSPRLAEAHRNRAQLLAVLDRDEEAMVAYETLLLVDPTDDEAPREAGRRRFARADYPRAAELLNRAFELEPTRADLVLLLGLSFFRTGRHAGARSALDEYFRLHGTSPVAYLALVQSLVVLGDEDPILDLCTKGVARYPDETRLWFELGRQLVRLERFDEALVAFSQAKERGSDRPPEAEVLAARGHVLLRLGKNAEAVEAFRETLDLVENVADVVGLGCALLALHEPALAAERLERARELAPKDGRIAVLLGKAFAALGRQEDGLRMLRRAEELGDKSVSLALSIAELQLQLKLDAEALQTYGALLEHDPDHIVALYNVGLLSVAAGYASDAQEPLRRVTRLAPEMTDAHRAMARVLDMLGRHAEAAESYKRIIELVPDDIDARLGFARSMRAQKRIDASLPRLQEAVLLAPLRADAHHALSRTLGDLGRTDEAVRSLEEAILLVPNDPDLLADLAFQHRAGNALAVALATADKALALRASDASLHRLRGMLLYDLGRDQDAKDELERAAWLGPNDRETETYLGLVFARLGHVAVAAEWLERASKAAGSEVEPRVALTLARALQELGRAPEAKNLLMRTRDSNTESAEVLFALAKAYEQAGELDQAVAAFREVTVLAGGSPEAYERAAHAYMKLDMPDAAATALKQLVRLRPEEATGWFDLGLAFEALTLHADAVEAWTKAAQLRPDHGATWSHLARAHRRNGERAAAVKAYRELLRVEPSSKAELLELVALLDELGDNDAKVDLLQQAAARAGEPQLVLELARARAENGDLKDALRAFEKGMALAIAPGAPPIDPQLAVVAFRAVASEKPTPSVRVALVLAFETLARLERATPETIVDFASCLEILGAAPEALGLLRRITSKESAPPRAYRALAEGLATAEHTPELTSAWERVVAVEPRATDARYALAACYLKERRRGEALAMLRSVVRIDEQHAPALSDLADLLEAQDDLRGAMDALSALARIRPNVTVFVRLARVYGALDKHEECVEALRNAVRLEPGSTENRVQLGLAQAQLDPPRAIETLEAALRLDPELHDARVMLAGLHRDAGDRRRALEHLEYLGKAGRHTALTRRNLAELLASEGRSAEAFASLKKAGARDPEDVAGNLLRGQLALELERYEEAVAAFEMVIGKEPASVTALEGVALGYTKMGSRERALAALRKLVKAAPERASAHEDLGCLLLEGADFDAAKRSLATSLSLGSENPRALLALAQCHEALGGLRECVNVLGRYVRLVPESAHPYVMMGASFETLGELNSAERAYESALERDRTLEGPRRRLVELFERRGAGAEATEHVRALAETSASAEDWYHLARLESEAGDVSSALAAAAKAIDLAPDYLPAWRLEAKLVAARGDRERGKAILQRLLSSEGADRETRLLLAQMHADDGEAMAAGAQLHAILTRTPEDVETHLALARLHESSGALPEAIRHFARAYRYGSHEPKTLISWARCLMVTGALDQAEEILQGAASSSPDDAGVHSSLGAVRYKRGQIPQAIDAFAHAIRLSPDNPELLAAIGAAYAAAGRAQDAARAYGEALRLGPDTPELRYHFGVALAKAGELAVARQQVTALEAASETGMAQRLRSMLGG